MTRASYLIAIGANRRGRHGAPADEVRAAIEALGASAASPIAITRPLGPSIRRFANAAALIDSDLPPPAMLACCKAIERAFGRRRGQRWGARVIDCDIILWSGGIWRTRTLTIPHPAMRARAFVLRPAAALVPDWRDPVSGRTVRQLLARLTRGRCVPNRKPRR